jgi:hypothetical protein
MRSSQRLASESWGVQADHHSSDIGPDAAGEPEMGQWAMLFIIKYYCLGDTTTKKHNV